MASLQFPRPSRLHFDKYLPTHHAQDYTPNTPTLKPFVTLTYACSLDSQIASKPGAPTALSGPASKCMTHYLRTKHDAILVGSGTAIADDPGLNSRLSDAVEQGIDLQPRPVILDRRARWAIHNGSKVIRAAREGKGKGPIIVLGQDELHNVPHERLDVVEQVGGSYIASSDFAQLLHVLAAKGIRSIMVEGGGQVINSLLRDYPHLIDVVIVTVAPVYLGQGGVVVCPEKHAGQSVSTPVVKFRDVKWIPLENDVVMCARIGQDT